MNITLMIAGSCLLLYSLYLIVFRRSIAGSDLSRMGGGISSYFSGKGIVRGIGGDYDICEGGIQDEVDQKGRPIMRGTRRILP